MIRKKILGLWLLCSLTWLLTACISDNDSDPSTPEVEVGNTLPDFYVLSYESMPYAPSFLRGKRSVIVFFHTECPDCQRELPIVNELYLAHREEPTFALICIASEESAKEILPFWQKHNLQMPFSPQPDRAVYSRFANSRIPRIYISDGDLRVRYIHTDFRMPDLETLEKELGSLE